MATRWIAKTPLVKFAEAIRSAPREIIWNKHLITTTLVFAFSAIPMTWDQGMGASVPSLPGFQHHFHISSGSNPEQIQNFVSFPYLGYIAGSLLTFFVNDIVGRKWTFRGSIVVHAIGQLVAIFAPNVQVLYASRIITGIGIGGLTVIGPMTLSEIAPAEIRGLITSLYVVSMQIALVTSNFCTYGIYLHLSPSRLQYQIVFFTPVIFMAVMVLCSFYVCESPRWLVIVNRQEESLNSLAKLRGLPASHPRVVEEYTNIINSMAQERPKLVHIIRETFTKKTNLRRVQQVLVAYALAQLSGANSITSYFIPIISLVSPPGGTARHIFLSGMYAFSKLWFSLIASFLFIDALGRRKSLFVGASVQMLTHFYIGTYLKVSDSISVTKAYSDSAIAALFLHAFGYSVGLLTLPYVFGSELWPNHLRAFGAAFTGSLHWAFIYAIKYAVPDILSSMDNWGAFFFFGGWCLVAIVYVYLVVPEVAGLSVEEIEEVFKGPWFKAYKRAGRVHGERDTGDHEKGESAEIEIVAAAKSSRTL